jgi:hypothetical protein
MVRVFVDLLVAMMVMVGNRGRYAELGLDEMEILA